MPRRQPQSARVARVAASLLALGGACVPGIAYGTEMTVVGLLTDAAAPALQAAAPSNDPALAGQELLNRSLASASTRTQRLGPAWLERVRFNLSFDPAFQPRYSLTVTQPLLTSSSHDNAIDLQGSVVHDAAGATGGDLGLQYRGRWYEQDVTLGVQGGAEDLRVEELQRYSVGAELGLRSLQVRTSLYDDVPARPASREIAERRLDGYDLEIGAQIPFVPWAWVWANRFWQIDMDGETVSTHDRVSLRLTPLAPLEIETGAETEADVHSWFARLRWCLPLGH
jgi:Inverse autotransporter, beta-domain